MDDTYTQNQYGIGANHQQGYGSSNRAKLPVRNPEFNVRPIDADSERHPKKRKLKSLVSSYEFAPRVPAPPIPTPPVPKQSFGGRNSLTDWTERETFVLLDAWGDKFIQRGRKSLRSEEWHDVAEKVSEMSKIERTDTQCRNRLDTLKKKYKKEKFAVSENASKWVYFKKLDMLLTSSQPQQGGVDSGEHTFTNPNNVYSNRVNGFDVLRDSRGNSESTDDSDDGLPPKKRKLGRQKPKSSSPFTILADSINKLSDVYEKTENDRRLQMVELEKMRMDFQMEIEMKCRLIVERAKSEIVKIRQGDDDDDDDQENDVSAENTSG
ncbi:hypothetical protein ACFE04_003925 [Oxalis oulophora]